MNKEEYIIKINEEEIVVDKQTYNLFLPLGKIIEDLSSNRQQLQNNWNELKKYIQEELKDAEDDFAEEDFIKVLDRMQELESRK